MSRLSEHGIVEATTEALDRLADAGGAQADRALDAARREALRSLDENRAAPWLWATAAAAAFALAVVVAFVDFNEGDFDDGEPALLAQQPPPEPVADAELYQEMEFYLWLSQELESE